MQNPLRISIITPSFNQGRFIERTIKSVLEQGYSNLEYIVVDGGSSDETLDILRKYDSQLQWISEKDEGQSDAINKGLRMATGDIVAFLNSDDTYEENALRNVVNFFTANPSIIWLTGRCRIIDEHDREVRRGITWYKNLFLHRYSFNALLVTNFISQPATFLRREVIEEFGFFNAAYHRVMDYDYWLRVGIKYPPGIVDDYLARFRTYKESKTSSNFVESFRQELVVCRKYSRSRTINVLHYLNFLGICSAYTIMNLVSRLKLKN